MKKILFIIWSHSLGGGAEALLTTIVNNLNPQKYQIGIIEIYHSETKKEQVNSNVKIYEPITSEGDTEYRKKLYYIYHDPARIVNRYISPGYDLYVSFNYQLPSFLLPEGTRNIAWVHGAVFDLNEEGMEEYRYLQSRAFEKAVRIVSISDITTQSLQILFPEHSDKFVEIYNSVNIREIREKADCFTDIELEHPSIICVGRLDENKNPLRMLGIFRRICESDKAMHLYFLGKGELESQVREKVREYNLEKRVHILGYIENPFPVIRQADVCCMTSKSEGFGLALLESIVLHVPFVSTETGVARVLSNGERCGKVYITDEEAVKNIYELLNAPRYLIEKECEKSISRFDLKVYISKIEQLFDEVLEKTVDSREKMVWDSTKYDGPLEDRTYYYHFPATLIPKGRKVVLYGAGAVGTDYYCYMKESDDYQIAAWVDADAEKYRILGKDVRDIDAILNLEYDVVLIAVMHESTVRSIREDLQARGIPEDRILWTRPIF